MQLISKRQALAYLREKRAPAAVIRALGEYSEDDANTHNQDRYNERSVFYAPGGTEGGFEIKNPPLIKNVNSFATYPFVIANTSFSILPANQKRSLLLVQNQSGTADLYVNFSSDAGVNNGILLVAGAAVILDTVCPNNSVAVFFDSATNEPGIVIEGAPQS
jgi:hypothetical protein